MFSRISAIAVLALPLLAAATTPTTPASECNTSELRCCNSKQEADSLTLPIVTLLTGLGVNVGALTGVVGLTCSPLTLLVGGGSSCTAQPVCCSNNDFGGLVSVGCTPINVNL